MKAFSFALSLAAVVLINPITIWGQEEMICNPDLWGKLYANPENLSTFYECTPQGLVLFACPEGLVFPIGGHRCEWPDVSPPTTPTTTTPITTTPTTMTSTTTTPTTTTPITTTPTTMTSTTTTPTTTTPTTTTPTTMTSTTTTPTTTTPTTTTPTTTTPSTTTPTTTAPTTTTPTTTTPTTTTPTTTTPTTTTPTTTTPTTTAPTTTTSTTTPYPCRTIAQNSDGNWTSAVNYCGEIGIGFQISTIESQEKYNCIVDVIEQSGFPEATNYWTAGSDLENEGFFIWTTTGGVVDKFYPDGNAQPDNGGPEGSDENCISMRKVYPGGGSLPTHQMNDDGCASQFAVLCDY